MPNGRTHDIITAVTTPVVVGGSYWLTKDIKTTMILMSTFIFASLMFNGDLDTNSRPYNRWFILKMIWIPYQLMFTHRSIWTHGIVLGTIVRILYLFSIPVIIMLFKGNLPSINWGIIIPILIGLELGNIGHTAADKIF